MRAGILLRQLQAMYRRLAPDIAPARVSRWIGVHPGLPDPLPVGGRPPTIDPAPYAPGRFA